MHTNMSMFLRGKQEKTGGKKGRKIEYVLLSALCRNHKSAFNSWNIFNCMH
jgi:hypothetical protein